MSLTVSLDIVNCSNFQNAFACKPMTLENICLKLNTKMGGINWRLQAEEA